MARTVSHGDLIPRGSPSRRNGLSWFQYLFERFLWAAEAQAIARIEREAGHLFSREDLARMKGEHLQRRPW